MDFTPELIAFQGVIMAANNKYSFDKITSRGGNEEVIQKIVQGLHKFFLEKHYYTSEGIPEKCKSEMKKFSFYIALNSDFKALNEIVDLPDLSHLVWTTPTITTHLFCEIVWTLKMESYIGELIQYSNPKLSVEILKTLVYGVRYCSAEDSIEKLSTIAISSFNCLCRMSFFDFDNVLTLSLISDLYTYFLRSITHFVAPPNAGKLEQLPEEDQYIHLGKSFRSLFNVTLACLTVYESPLQFNSDQFEIFLSTISADIVKFKCLPNSVKENSHPAVLEYLQKCNVAALDKCVELVMRVSVDVFCTWSEHVEDGRSLQRCIGELCYNLNNKLKNMDVLSKHTIVSMLPQLSCKPADIHDVIREADEDTLITSAYLNTSDREHWLNAIIERENLFESDPLMTCLLRNVTFLKPEACEDLFDKCIAFLQHDSYQNDMAKTLAVESFARVDSGKKCELLHEVFSDYTIHDHLEQPEFSDKINETFNKLISTSESSLSEICDLFIQNPCEVYEKILNVGVENIKQANLMVNAIVILKDFSEHRCDGEKEPALLNAIEKLCAVALETEVQENSFICLLSKLCREIAILQGPLLLRIFMPYVHKSMVNKDFRNLKLHLKVVSESYDVEQLVPYRPPLLAMIGQVLAVVRWDFTTYSPEAPATLQQAIDLQTSLVQSYQSQIPDKDINWLKGKLKNLKPLNMYYYKELWSAPGENFLQVITGVQKIDQEEFPVLLAKILNGCTQREWSLVWMGLVRDRDRDWALELMYQALVVVSLAESKHRSENSRACLLYCFRCFTCIVKENLFDDESQEFEVKKIIEKFVGLANIIPERDVDDIGAILLPLFASATSKRISDISYLEIVNKLNNGKFAKLVESVLNNSAS